MKALVKTSKGPGNIEIQEENPSIPFDDWVLIKLKAAGVCVRTFIFGMINFLIGHL